MRLCAADDVHHVDAKQVLIDAQPEAVPDIIVR